MGLLHWLRQVLHMARKKAPGPTPSDLDHDLHHVIRDLHRLQGDLFMIAQAITDAQTRLNTAVAAVDAKVTELLGRPAADPNAATPDEQAAIAAAIVSAAAAIEATNAKS